MPISRIAFTGQDANGNPGLWVTTRSSAGTGELTVAGANELTVAGSYANGVFSNVAAPDFTALGNKVVFTGQDASGNPNLWVTDGSSAGTTELTVAGANAGGLFSQSFFPSGFSPGFTAIGSRALFEGYDASGIDSLWVTDGTSAGTRELTVAGSNANGLFFDVSASDLTVFAGRALFAGEDASGDIGLWVTDATGAGTSELTVAGSFANGLFYNVTPPDFTVLGNKVLFAGEDANGNANFWATDGTSAGTSELAVAGANAGGLFDLNYFPAGFS